MQKDYLNLIYYLWSIKLLLKIIIVAFGSKERKPKLSINETEMFRFFYKAIKRLMILCVSKLQSGEQSCQYLPLNVIMRVKCVQSIQVV